MKEYAEYRLTLNSDSSETIAYNYPLFPVYIRYGFLSRYPNYAAVSHWHNDLEFILIKKGKMTYNVNGKLIELYENQGIMVNSRQIHYGFSAEHTECEFICILLSPELLQGSPWFYHNYVEAVTDNFAYPYLYFVSDGWQADVLGKVELLYQDFVSRAGDDSSVGLSCFRVIEGFCAILELLYENLPAPQQKMEKESSEIIALRNMITYVEEHFAKHMTLYDIASAGACCKSRCSLLFKKYLHDTPISYLTKLRLRRSLGALLETDESITDIAYEYGFGGASYYCETFRKYYGTSPLQYKKEQLLSAGK
ncbi:MAG: AraC family transcriptional regulator [Muribaculaceae bacterium]|nr:AraC family transcriptional regulator [Muribaculaceae bacterium]